MSVFTPDFAAVDAGFPIYDRGMYRVKITAREPAVWEKNDEHGNVTIVSRVRYKLEMFGMLDDDGEVQTTDANGKEIIGKSVQAMDVYLHTKDAWSFAKLFLMAAFGYSKNEENEFNEFFQENKDEFMFSGDAGDPDETLNDNLGSAWDAPVDRMVDVFLQKTLETYQGEERENQKMSAWQPVGEQVSL